MKCNIFLNFIREKHKRYTPDPITGIKQRKRKHKRKSLDVENPEGQSQPEIHRRITIKVYYYSLYIIHYITVRIYVYTYLIIILLNR